MIKGAWTLLIGMLLNSDEAVDQQRTSFRQEPIIRTSLRGAYIDRNFQYDKFLLEYSCVLIVIYISDIYLGGQRGQYLWESKENLKLLKI